MTRSLVRCCEERKFSAICALCDALAVHISFHKFIISLSFVDTMWSPNAAHLSCRTAVSPREMRKFETNKIHCYLQKRKHINHTALIAESF